MRQDLFDLQAVKNCANRWGHNRPALMYFAQTGEIIQPDCETQIIDAIGQAKHSGDRWQAISLQHLLAYVRHYGPREPVHNWGHI